MRIRTVLLGAVMCGLLASGISSASAAAPSSGPVEIKRFDFEPGGNSFDSLTAFVDPLAIAPKAYWGVIASITPSAPGSTRSLWCAGTKYPEHIPSSYVPTYPVGTAGDAAVTVTETADYYASSVTYSYLMPTAGRDDRFAVGVLDDSHTARVVDSSIPLVSAWAARSLDLAVPQLSRSACTLLMRFTDQVEVIGGSGTLGQGPAVDNVVFKGYRYGRVDDITVTSPGPGQISLSWAAPDRAIGSSEPDTRTVSYRVWRANEGSEVWQELTANDSRIPGNSYTDDNAVDGAKYKYIVQAWDPGTGAGRGLESPFATWPARADRLDIPSGPVTIVSPNSFTSMGALLPAHAPGAAAVEIQCSRNKSTITTTVAGVLAADGTTYSGKVTLGAGTWYIRARHVDAGHSETFSGWRQVDVLLPLATLGAPKKPAISVYRWRPFATSGSIAPAHAGASTVSIQCSRDGSTVEHTYTGTVAAGSATYSASAVKLPQTGTWYIRARHEDSTHRESFSPWTAVTVSDVITLSVPKAKTTMSVNKTYTAYGTIKPAHSKTTYIKVRAYRYNGKQYAYVKSFAVTLTTAGQAADTAKYSARVKLTKKGKWKLKARHYAHGEEPEKLTAFGSRITVK